MMCSLLSRSHILHPNMRIFLRSTSRARLLAIVLGLGWAPALLAQSLPFSGRWLLDAQPDSQAGYTTLTVKGTTMTWSGPTRSAPKCVQEFVTKPEKPGTVYTDGRGTKFVAGVKGTLRVAAPVTFAAMYVAPILPTLRARHPQLTLDLRLDDTAVSLIDESIDVAIRIGSLDAATNLVARRLTGHARVLCASPAYLAQRGTPRHPADLAAHDCLQFAFADNRRTWRLRRNAGIKDVKVEDMPVEEIAVNAVVQANNGELLRRAALAGLGVAMLADWLVREDLAAGRLVRVLADYDVNPGPMDVGLHALYQANRRGSHKIHAFVDLLAEQLAQAGVSAG